ncbi:4-coumarate--CoA ligase, photoactive yellow protein activation family [Marinospirillum celere]|uniref:4-coumarate--CoA ligase, photoactive yellow protein activation family n=1 Tax=Marinospirillum celere TaxID=1122252 RepID=A0A1I1DU23_9GAMM|nr:AMP-binding protein [Marinospirillum celere]SFB78391.1 4-coumarate--CoA ligase, photoactive yellow protein activation family [Marinospirillum celere]
MSNLELSSTQLFEVTRSLLADELKGLRPHAVEEIFPEDWKADTWISTPLSGHQALSLHADSLERMALATRVADFFEIRESGLEDYLLRFKTLGEWVELVQEARKRGSRNLTFLTSGSSGEPKPCPQSWDTLVNEVDYFREYFTSLQKEPIKRILVLNPCHHIYGFLFSVILPDRLQVPVIRGHQAFFQVQGRKLLPGDLIVGFPYAWKQLARSQKTFPEGIIGLTSTGPCDPKVIEQLHQQGLQSLVEIYGSSETGGIGYRANPQQPFQLLPRWQRFEDSNELLLEKASHQPVALNDLLEWQNQQAFYPRGRLDEAVQVGGINVFPQQLEKRLQDLPGVEAAKVRLMSPSEGERLKAFIVPEVEAAKNPEALIRQLDNWCRQHLAAAEQPKAFTLGSQLPVNDLGKSCDWPLQTRPLPLNE